MTTWTIWDANWADAADIEQGSAALDDAGNVVEYAEYWVEAETREEALFAHANADSDRMTEYTLTPVEGPTVIIIPYAGASR